MIFQASISRIWLLLRKCWTQQAVDQALGVLLLKVCNFQSNTLTCSSFFSHPSHAILFPPKIEWGGLKKHTFYDTDPKDKNNLWCWKTQSCFTNIICACSTPWSQLILQSCPPHSWTRSYAENWPLSPVYLKWLSASKGRGLIWHSSQSIKIPWSPYLFIWGVSNGLTNFTK